MIIGRNLVESLYSDFNGYEDERFYSESELEELMEIAFSEGYEEAERLFGDPEGRHRTEETYVRERQGGKTARVAEQQSGKTARATERNKTARHAVGEVGTTARGLVGEVGKTARHAVGETGTIGRGIVGEGGKTIRHAGETLRGMGKDYLEAGTKNLKNYEDFAAADRSNRRSARTERMEVRSGRQAKKLDAKEGRMGRRNENRAHRRENYRGMNKDYYDAVLSNQKDRRREGLVAKIVEDRKDARRARNERYDRKLTAVYGR